MQKPQASIYELFGVLFPELPKWSNARPRFGVRRYHHDDGEVGTVEDCGWFDTPGEAAARVIAVLRRVVRDEGDLRHRHQPRALVHFGGTLWRILAS
jgi:hypothetical protein